MSKMTNSSQKVVNIDSYKDIPGATYVKLSEAREALIEARKISDPAVFVTTQHDYGLCYQKEHSIAMDMKKDFALNFETYAQEIGEGNGLEPIYFTPRANVAHCQVTDKYSVKIDTWTHCTYELDIPDNVVWFMPNCNVDHPRIRHLPFGVNHPDPDDAFNVYTPREIPAKQDKVYLNFSEHTFQRMIMNMTFEKYDWATVIRKNCANDPGEYSHQEYMKQLADHRYVLCPPGVGLDSYRVWETLFVGSIPVMEKDYWNSWMQDLFPVILVDDFYDIVDINYLDFLVVEAKIDFGTFNFDSNKISEDFWRGQIEDAIKFSG